MRAATWCATTATKALVGRVRPEWQTPIDVLDSGSFPSGHTSSIVAFTGVVLVLLSMLVRRRAVRHRRAHAARIRGSSVA